MSEQGTPVPAPGLIYQAIPRIIGRMVPLAKDQTNRDQGYKFRSIDQVYGALKNALADEKVSMIPFVVEHAESQHTSSRGTIMHRVTLTVEYLLLASDGSKVSARVRSEGIDSSDKATSKAMSFAFKYAAFQCFCIPVEGEMDPDATSPTITAPAAKPATPPAPAKPTKAEKLARLKAAFPGDNCLWLEEYFRSGMEDAEGHAISWIAPGEGLDSLDERHIDVSLRKLKQLVEKVQQFAEQNAPSQDTTP